MNNLISIIVPIYNAEPYLSKCIESILSQTHKNLQLILVNDGSTDNSLRICNYFKSLDARVVVINKPNEGVSAARNIGLEVAEGDYIGFVDSDDYVEKNMYELLLDRIHKDNSQVCVMSEYTVNNFGKKINNNATINGNEALKRLLLLRFPTSLWAYLYSKEIIKNCKLNEEIHFFEDFEFNFRILATAAKVSFYDNRLYNYRINANSINSQKINDRRLTCLNIYEFIIKEIDNKGFSKYAMYSRAHFLVSIIASISKSTNVDDKYYKVAREHAQNMRKEILRSMHVPLKYKVTILMFSINPYFLSKLLYNTRYRSYR